VGLVDDHGVLAPGEVADLLGDEGELLQCRDHDRHARTKGLGELRRIAVDLLHDPLPVLELVDRILELLVEHDAVRDDHDRVENLLVVGVVRGREAVRQPGIRRDPSSWAATWRRPGREAVADPCHSSSR